MAELVSLDKKRVERSAEEQKRRAMAEEVRDAADRCLGAIASGEAPEGISLVTSRDDSAVVLVSFNPKVSPQIVRFVTALFDEMHVTDL